MSAEKGELRAAVMTELGSKIEDLLDASVSAVARSEGAEAALDQAVDVICQLHRDVDNKIEAGEITELEVGQAIKDWITRAAGICKRMSNQHGIAKSVQRGHAQGLRAAVQLTQRARDAELRTVEEHRLRESDQPPDDNRSIKEIRLAEDAAEVAASLPPPPQEGASLAPGPNGAPKQRRRRRATQAPPSGGHAADT